MFFIYFFLFFFFFFFFIVYYFFFFFFSSRRRHTRWTGDWSSDVCSSDLLGPPASDLSRRLRPRPQGDLHRGAPARRDPLRGAGRRSEERRVGKECRSR